MTTGDEIDAIHLRRDEGVASLAIFVITKMRHANYEGTALFFA